MRGACSAECFDEEQCTVVFFQDLVARGLLLLLATLKATLSLIRSLVLMGIGTWVDGLILYA